MAAVKLPSYILLNSSDITVVRRFRQRGPVLRTRVIWEEGVSISSPLPMIFLMLTQHGRVFRGPLASVSNA